MATLRGGHALSPDEAGKPDPKIKHWYDEDVWLLPVGPRKHFNTHADGTVLYREVSLHGAIIGHLWFSDSENAAAFNPRADFRTLANNASVAWSRSLLQARGRGLSPSEAVAELTAAGGNLLQGHLSPNLPIRTADSSSQLPEANEETQPKYHELGNRYAHNELLTLATRIADKAHGEQDDHADDPYILHPLRMALAVNSEQAKIVAVLHDVLERTSITVDDLSAAGFSTDIVNAINALTERRGETLKHSIARVRTNSLAVEVKRAEIADNSDEWRLSRLSEGTRSRLRKKYYRSLELLER